MLREDKDEDEDQAALTQCRIGSDPYLVSYSVFVPYLLGYNAFQHPSFRISYGIDTH
jgi:hypothetical protein